jgi:hypothetical protein
MTIKYEWDFKLHAEDIGSLERVVNMIEYRCTGTDGTHAGEFPGRHSASTPGTPGAAFTPWADLTPEIVKGWLPAELIEQAEASVAAQIAAKADAAAKNRTVGVPWALTPNSGE